MPYKRSKSRSKRSRSKSKNRRSCQDYLRKKVRKNIDEYKGGRYTSRQQAIAVSYAQTKKKHPSCSRFFRRSK